MHSMKRQHYVLPYGYPIVSTVPIKHNSLLSPHWCEMLFPWNEKNSYIHIIYLLLCCLLILFFYLSITVLIPQYFLWLYYIMFQYLNSKSLSLFYKIVLSCLLFQINLIFIVTTFTLKVVLRGILVFEKSQIRITCQ